MKLLHLSDTHFGTEKHAVVAGLLEWVGVHRPDLLVLSGDVTQRARTSEFAAALRFVTQLCEAARMHPTNDVLVLPGNHDIPLFNLWARWRHPYAQFQAAWGPELEPQWQRPGLCVVGVNTTRAWRHKDGEVSAKQVDQVAARLRQAQGNVLRVVVTHQPLHVLQSSDRKDLLHGHAHAAHAWSAAGCDLVLSGHIHQAFVTPLRTAYPGMPHDTWVVQSGTAVSSRTRSDVPNTFHLLDVGAAAGRCVAVRWDWQAASQRFVQVQTTHIP